jgi:hypothetical protein
MLNAIPVTPSRSHELRPDTTADSATTNRFIFRPPRKNSLSPADDVRADQMPIPTSSRR